MESKVERIKNDIETIAQFNTTPGNGTTRYTYSKEDQGVREYLIKEMTALGLDIIIDAIGNIRGRLKGKNNELPVVMTGSHIDTVTYGGNFDGVAGVIAGLEALRVFVENGVKPMHPIELIVFVEEEGPQFNFPLAGSRILTGKYDVEVLKDQKNNDGISMYEKAIQFGLDPSEMKKYLFKKNEIKAMIELHIEQSVVLDELNIPVGIVEAVAGRKWIELSFMGNSNHAGATPMQFRKDPMVGAAQIIANLREIVTEKANETTVGTVGRINCYPNEPNVIPEKVTFTIDVRDTDQNGIDTVEKEVRALAEEVCQTYHLKFTMEQLSETQPILFSKEVIDAIELSATNRKTSFIKMNSGALHDSCLMNDVTQVGMIFVPSIEGRSHCPQELTQYTDIKAGVDVLIGALIELAGL